MSWSMSKERSIETRESKFTPSVDDMIKLFQNVLDVTVRDNSDKRKEVNRMPSTQHTH